MKKNLLTRAARKGMSLIEIVVVLSNLGYFGNRYWWFNAWCP